jgi:hypothetical protein
MNRWMLAASECERLCLAYAREPVTHPPVMPAVLPAHARLVLSSASASRSLRRSRAPRP